MSSSNSSAPEIWSNQRTYATGPQCEWIMTGHRLPNGRVRIYASRKVPHSLQFGQSEVFGKGTHWHIETDCTELRIVDGTDWNAALAQLFQAWSNEDAEEARKGLRARGAVETRTESGVTIHQPARALPRPEKDQAAWASPDADVKGDVQQAMRQAENPPGTSLNPTPPGENCPKLVQGGREMWFCVGCGDFHATQDGLDRIARENDGKA
jgi:hypothetical protein